MNVISSSSERRSDNKRSGDAIPNWGRNKFKLFFRKKSSRFNTPLVHQRETGNFIDNENKLPENNFDSTLKYAVYLTLGWYFYLKRHYRDVRSIKFCHNLQILTQKPTYIHCIIVTHGERGDRVLSFYLTVSCNWRIVVSRINFANYREFWVNSSGLRYRKSNFKQNAVQELENRRWEPSLLALVRLNLCLQAIGFD